MSKSLCSTSRLCTSPGMHRTRATANRPVFAAPLPARGDRCKTAAINEIVQIAALDIDWTDPDVQIGVLGGVLGLGLGVGAPLFYSLRDDRDEERLEELRALNRATFKETGEYLTEVRICIAAAPVMAPTPHRRRLQTSGHPAGPIAGVLMVPVYDMTTTNPQGIC